MSKRQLLPSGTKTRVKKGDEQWSEFAHCWVSVSNDSIGNRITVGDNPYSRIMQKPRKKKVTKSYYLRPTD